MATYLELVQELVAELGIGGANNGAAVPTAVTTQTGQLWNAANWVKQANNNINLLHLDWNFLFTEYSESLTAGSTSVPGHSGAEVVRKFNRGSFWLNRTSANASQLEWMDWPRFRNQVLPGSSTRTNSRPATFTIKPDNTLLVDNPADQAYTLTAEFWRRPPLLSANGDTPLIPEEYHRIIICEAAIKYGNKEAAAEVIQGMSAEYEMLLERLEAAELPLREWEDLGAEDIDLTVDIPGYC